MRCHVLSFAACCGNGCAVLVRFCALKGLAGETDLVDMREGLCNVILSCPSAPLHLAAC